MSENTIAFLFPGQGSQKVGMLADAYARFNAVQDVFTEASDAVGYDMWKLIQEGEQEALNLTETTQPVLLTSSVALWHAWQQQGGAMPGVVAGHSLGEFSALVCAGVLGFGDAVNMVRQRGAFMQSAVPVGKGAMAAIIGLDDDTINTICADITTNSGLGAVAAVNYNSPGQVVIAGHTEAVEEASTAIKSAGAKRAMPLPVSAPFHTELMRPAGEQLAEVIANTVFLAPQIPVVHNVHAQTESDPQKIKSLMVEQIYSPVRWAACIQAISASGAINMVECGPGKVLSGLNRRIDKSLQSFSIENPEDLLKTQAELSA